VRSARCGQSNALDLGAGTGKLTRLLLSSSAVWLPWSQLPLLGEVGSLLDDGEYRRLWETHV
jgi:hypothetical protein